MTTKTQLVTKLVSGYSIRLGRADGRCHFDHRGPHTGQPAPCIDGRIPVVPLGVTIDISCLDAVTFVGLLRMYGKALPTEVDLHLLAKELTCSSCVANRFHPTVLYEQGIRALQRELGFPRPISDAPTDVTRYIAALMAKPESEIIAAGRDAQKKAENAYSECKVEVAGKVGFWVVERGDAFDITRPHDDGVEVVMVYYLPTSVLFVHCSRTSRLSMKELGVVDSNVKLPAYCSTVAGIHFCGEQKAARSVGGVVHEDSYRVFHELCMSAESP